MKRFLRASAIVVAGLALASAAFAATFVKQDRVTLRALDKITGRATDITVKVGEPVVYGSLKVEVKACFQTPPEEVPESAAFLRIASTKPVAVESMEAAVAVGSVETANAENPLLFSGWMYASSPGLSALEHPVYDIWVIRCTAPAPVKLPERVIISEGDEPLSDDVPGEIEEVDEPAEPEPAD